MSPLYNTTLSSVSLPMRMKLTQTTSWLNEVYVLCLVKVWHTIVGSKESDGKEGVVSPARLSSALQCDEDYEKHIDFRWDSDVVKQVSHSGPHFCTATFPAFLPFWLSGTLVCADSFVRQKTILELHSVQPSGSPCTEDLCGYNSVF